MCGRYTLTIDKSTIEHRFGAKFYIAAPSFDWSPTFNAAPSQMLPIIRTYNPDRIELALGLLAGGVEAVNENAPADKCAPRDRGREAHVRVIIPRPALPRPRGRLL
jgi:putative SOS response-associated peptidase YedK